MEERKDQSLRFGVGKWGEAESSEGLAGVWKRGENVNKKKNIGSGRELGAEENVRWKTARGQERRRKRRTEGFENSGKDLT